MHQGVGLVPHSGDGRHWSEDQSSEEDQMCCGKTGTFCMKMDSGGSAVWMEEGRCCFANPECCERTESCCVVRLTRRLARINSKCPHALEAVPEFSPSLPRLESHPPTRQVCAEYGRLCLADRDTVRKYGRGSRLNAVETPPRIKPQYLYWLMTWSVSEWRSS